jgi:hypothetical protein
MLRKHQFRACNGCRSPILGPTIITCSGVAASSRRLELTFSYAPDRVIPAPWQNMLRACSAVEVFDFFHSAGLATHS